VSTQLETTSVEEISGVGTRVTGPSALSGGWRRMAHLAWTLAFLEFRLKFFGSVLGYFWQLMRPLMLFSVYYVVFTQFVPLNKDVKFYPPLLLTAIMLYQFWAEATSGAVRSVVDRENLVRKIHFPRIVIPLTVNLAALLNLAVNLIAVLVFVVAAQVPLRWSWLWVIPLLMMLTAFAFGLSLLLSALFVKYRDVAPIWDVVTMAAFYATPIIYVIELVQIEWARQLIMYNPLAVVIQQLRHSVFDPSVPNAVEQIGGYAQLMVPLGIVAGVCVLGFWVFNRAAPDVAENL
jgi:ABC-2 type transport system permease protein